MSNQENEGDVKREDFDCLVQFSKCSNVDTDMWCNANSLCPYLV